MCISSLPAQAAGRATCTTSRMSGYLPTREDVINKTYTEEQVQALHRLFSDHGMDLQNPWGALVTRKNTFADAAAGTDLLAIC